MTRQINEDLSGFVIEQITMEYHEDMNCVQSILIENDGVRYMMEIVSTDWDSTEFVIERVGVNNDR